MQVNRLLAWTVSTFKTCRLMGCSWQSSRQQLRESVSAKPLLNPVPLTPLAACLWGSSLRLTSNNTKRKKTLPK